MASSTIGRHSAWNRDEDAAVLEIDARGLGAVGIRGQFDSTGKASCFHWRSLHLANERDALIVADKELVAVLIP